MIKIGSDNPRIENSPGSHIGDVFVNKIEVIQFYLDSPIPSGRRNQSGRTAEWRGAGAVLRFTKAIKKDWPKLNLDPEDRHFSQNLTVGFNGQAQGRLTGSIRAVIDVRIELNTGEASVWHGGSWPKDAKALRDLSSLQLIGGDAASYLAVEMGLKYGAVYVPEPD